ncbi:MAG: hypothetical protein DYG88_07255 [Chloroflexi bacterium CFX4]|nr:hypothetical protein [Chloroflexi bacterium CFX4]MDL1921989.1 hypothetical protein [Chloroflexi bacterium CFX3]
MIRLVLAISMVLVLLAPATVQAQGEVCLQTLPFPEVLSGELITTTGTPFVKAAADYPADPPSIITAGAAYLFNNIRVTQATVAVYDFVGSKSAPILLEAGLYFDDGVRLNPIAAVDRMYLPNRYLSWWAGQVFMPPQDVSDIVNTVIITARVLPASVPPGGAFIGIALTQICFLQQMNPTPTPILYTPFPRTTTPTASSTPTRSVTPTSMPTYTPTQTLTFTPVTHTATASLTPSITLTASETVPPSETPISTLPSEPVPSPQLPQNACADPDNPCAIFPEPVFPTVALVMPTLVGTVNYTLSPLPSMTAVGTPSGQTTAVAIELMEVATQVGLLQAELGMEATRILLDAQGTPVDVANAAYTFGGSIGGFFGIVRQFSEHGTGIGRTGDILLVIIALIAFNLLVRLLLFAIPIVKTILEIIGTVIRTVIGLIRPI